MSNRQIFILLAVVFLDCAIWQQVFLGPSGHYPQAHFLDVGQGDATLLELSPTERILIDTGPRGKIIPALNQLKLPGRQKIDLVLITHPEADHFGGLAELAVRFELGAVLVNGRAADDGAWTATLAQLRKLNVPIYALGQGDNIHSGDFNLSILSPDLTHLGSAALNDTGLVSYIHMPDYSILLPADIDLKTEGELVARGLPGADIIKMPHHGSKTSGGQALLQAVRPKIAVIEVGADNRYGHPSPEVIERLKLFLPLARILRTDELGNITITRDGGELVVRTDR